MTRLRTAVALVAVLVCSPNAARADDVVLEWNGYAVATLIGQGQSPFAQARYLSITQLAVFEAVNAITHKYEPYLGTVVAPVGARADAAAIAAAYAVLTNYFPAAPGLLLRYNTSLAAIPDGQAKADGIAAGQAAAAQMIALRVGDGASPATLFPPEAPVPGAWQKTLSSVPACPAGGGTNFQWQNVTPFGVPSAPGSQDWIEQFAPSPPPALTSNKYAKDYNEVKRVGSATANSTDRPPDRADVARFFVPSSPSFVFNSAARQVAVAQGKSLVDNARALALISMASNDAFIVSFWTKYHYKLWRPETAIHGGDVDGNGKTTVDAGWAPYIAAPCFPAYPSNHASGSTSAAEMLRRLYGAGGHSITLTNAAVPGVVLNYSKFKQITDDVDDARVYGGIHFRFDQEAGGRLGRDIAKYIYKHNLRRAKHSQKEGEDEGENEDEDE